ncbi:MAG: tail fiber domain-containing protein [Gammaproteobacteria bacterium]|nr:tail fiber domain-containing protein [Acholeplasmataceae bacterium]MCK9529061.1 tail fiber domain-containing protein [Gammaproteobacteria bacterium]
MSNPIIVRYDLDRTGISPDNRVVGEIHELSNRRIRPISPHCGPFFLDNLLVRDSLTQQELVMGVDWEPSELYTVASLDLAKEIYALILITNPDVSNSVEIDYQVVGGEYSFNTYAIVKMIEDLELDNRPVDWPNIIGKPDEFTPAPHLHDVGDTFGWEYTVQALYNIRDAILMGDRASHDQILDYIDSQITSFDDLVSNHINNTNNPHSVTKAQVGLGNVSNFSTATPAQTSTGTATNLFVTPEGVTLAITNRAVTPLNTHISNTSNPHNVTKAQVGLGSVNNYSTATPAETNTGTASNLYVTPAGVLNAINTRAVTPLNAFIARRDNPHVVTKPQVGLGNVDNFATANNSQAVAGTATNLFITPASLKATIDSRVPAGMVDHVTNINNPHQVTKAQVGLGLVDNYGTASSSQAVTGTATNLFVTPAGLRAAIDNRVPSGFATHLTNTNNPHSVTKAQVGLGNVNNYGTATPAEANTGTASNLYVTPAGLLNAINTRAVTPLTTHTSNTSNPHNVTAAQVGAYTKSEIDTMVSNLSNSYLPLAGGSMTGRITNTPNAATRVQMDSSPTTLGAILFDAGTTATGDAEVAGFSFRAGTNIVKMGLNNTGVFGWGGGTRSPWSFYSLNNGDVVASGDVTAYSDPRLKENVKPILNALDINRKLSGKYFIWKDLPHVRNKAGTSDLGVMADEVEAVLPEAVKESVEYDGQTYKTVAYGKIVPVLIEAVKELELKVLRLESML